MLSQSTQQNTRTRRVLRAKQSRGAWGLATAERVVQLAGAFRHQRHWQPHSATSLKVAKSHAQSGPVS